MKSAVLCTIALLAASCECGSDVPQMEPPALPPMVAKGDGDATPPSEPPRAPADPRHATVHQASELGAVDMAQLERLDLALSEHDQVGHIEAEGATSTACIGLDLVRLATAAPRLASLRISGCPDAVRAGLGAFAGKLKELELSDMVVDEVIVGRVAQLGALDHLTFRRVEGNVESYNPLRKLDLRGITLAELNNRDAGLSTMLDLWPKRLEVIAFQGKWAGHRAMLTVSKAEALKRIELRDTRVANYSLNQIKPLEHLEEVVYIGPTFTDNSPLYFRHLPVKRFVCECPRMGDGGLRSLRHSKVLEDLELRNTGISGAGLARLDNQLHLARLVLTGVDVDLVGFEALAALPRLRTLDIAGEMVDPTLEGLGLLTSLEALTLRYAGLDDKAAPQLSKLVNLRELDLSRTRISDSGLAALASLKALEVLRLHHTQVTNRGLEHLAGLTALRVLELDHTDVVDAGVAHLRPLTNLEELRLDSTLITDAGLEHITTLRSLRRLNLADTVVTDAGVAKLATLPRLQVLRLEGSRAN